MAALDWLRLTRVPLAPTAVCDSLACGLVALQMRDAAPADVPLTRWAAIAGTSLLLYLAGMAANDLADRERDATHNANRPLPSGALSPRAVTIAVALLGAGALALAHHAGSLPAAAAALVLALLYDFVVRSPWWLAALCMGSVRFANASLLVAPFVFAGVITPWAFAAPACIGLYSTAITVWSTTEDELAPQRLVVARGLIVVAAGGATAVAWIAAGRPTLGAVIGAGIASSTLFGRTPRADRPAKAQVLELLLGLYFVAAILASAVLDGAPGWGLLGVVIAWLLSIASQLMVRAFIRRARAT